MNVAPVDRPLSAHFQLKHFLALSRTPHGLLDMATPALAALLCYGAFPPLRVILLGLMTAFAGYTAVYALNDLLDFRGDKEKLEQGGFRNTENYLDAVLVRHPMAYGLLGFKEALIWAIAWALLALIGATLLNPWCAVFFLSGCALETVYCLMWRTSHLRTMVSGAVKTAGGMAAAFAVDPSPSLPFLLVLFLWLFFWEIGGQNIPADWTDIEEDRMLKAKTIPIRFGPDWSTVLILSSLILAVVLNGTLFAFSQLGSKIPPLTASLFAGLYLLLTPAYQLYRTREKLQASLLFNRASYYPLSLLAVVSLNLMLLDLK